MAYAKSMVHELVTGKKNPQIELKILNFIRYIDTISPKAAEIVSANLPGGTGKHWMPELNKQERKECLMDSSVGHMKAQMTDGIRRCTINGMLCLLLSLN
jgi:hypothetical protein